MAMAVARWQLRQSYGNNQGAQPEIDKAQTEVRSGGDCRDMVLQSSGIWRAKRNF